MHHVGSLYTLTYDARKLKHKKQKIYIRSNKSLSLCCGNPNFYPTLESKSRKDVTTRISAAFPLLLWEISGVCSVHVHCTCEVFRDWKVITNVLQQYTTTEYGDQRNLQMISVVISHPWGELQWCLWFVVRCNMWYMVPRINYIYLGEWHLNEVFCPCSHCTFKSNRLLVVRQSD